MRALLHAVFGARGQVVVGLVATIIGAALWGYGIYLIRAEQREAVVDLIFHASMYFGLVACYAIIATGLGYRATERVEAHVANVAEADEVNVAEAKLPQP